MFDFHFLQLSHIFQHIVSLSALQQKTMSQIIGHASGQEFSSGDVQMPLLLKTAKFFPIAKWTFFDEGYWKDHP